MKSIRTTPAVHAGEGDERNRTAVCAPSADPAYDHLGNGRTACDCGRMLATAADWHDPAIDDGDRDDICWGLAANHFLEYPDSRGGAA